MSTPRLGQESVQGPNSACGIDFPYPRTRPASRIPAARYAAYLGSTTNASPTIARRAGTFSAIHSLVPGVIGVNRTIVPSLRTRTSG